MNTESLIHQLAIDVRPVKPIASPIFLFVLWSLAAIVFITLVVGFTGIRPDILAALTRPTFVLRLVFMLGIVLASVFLAFRLSIPAERRPFVEFAPMIAVSAWLLFFAYLFLVSNGTSKTYVYACVRNVLAFSVPTGLLLYFMLKKAAPMRSGIVGMMAALGSAALASLGTQLICRNEGPLHIFVSHFIPILAACLVGVFLGRWIFRWDRAQRSSQV